MDQQTAERLEMLLTYRLLLTPKDVAATCAVSLPVVYSWFQRSDFPSITVGNSGRSKRVSVDGLKAWLNAQVAQGS